MSGVARILTIDGGGIRGIIPALILQRIEERLNKPISKLFHMIAGTSTGGILACTLTAPVNNNKPKPAEEVVGLYRDHGKDIFDKSFWHGFGSLGGLVDEKYDEDHLEDLLKDYLGQTRLSDVSQDLLITSYDIHSRKPHFFKSWKARGEKLRPSETAEGRDFLLRDAARATSAAPTYFEPANVRSINGKNFYLVDGGVYANNPVMCAYSAAQILYPNSSRYMIVSLGTGETQRQIAYDDAKGWGLVGWARPLLYILFDGVSDVADYHMQQMFSNRDYFRFQADISSDPNDHNAPNDDMDDARPENIATLERLAHRILQDNKDRFSRLVNQLKSPIADRAALMSGQG